MPPWSAAWSARVPRDPLLALEARWFDARDRADEGVGLRTKGVRPTIYAGVQQRENSVALGPGLPYNVESAAC